MVRVLAKWELQWNILGKEEKYARDFEDENWDEWVWWFFERVDGKFCRWFLFFGKLRLFCGN